MTTEEDCALEAGPPPSGPGVVRLRGRIWLVLVAALLVLAVTASLVAAATWGTSVRRDQDRAFAAESSGVAAAVSTAIQRLGDLTLSASAVYQSNPQMTNDDFRGWLSMVDESNRYPGVIAFGGVAFVRRPDLSRFLAVLRADPPSGAPTLTYDQLPAKATYCLPRFSSTIDKASTLWVLMANSDLCNAVTGPLFKAAADDGHKLILPFQDFTTGRSAFMIISPVYRSRAVPSTISGRRAQLQGWLGGVFDADTILESALVGHPGMGVELTRIEPGAATASFAATTAPEVGLVASAGAARSKHQHRTRLAIVADGGWRLDVVGPLAGGISAGRQALAVLSGCLLLTALVFSLLLVLGRGRQRALRLVDLRTGQLEHQALHDPLTGLPNRALIMNRTEQLLVRARRDQVIPAALFLDLDGFKGINDTLGHQAGDLLLQEVAARLQKLMRSGDTVGRLGGDEFIILVECGQDPGSAELVAERVLDCLREPFVLLPAPGSFTVTASIGVATGERTDAANLLRDADVALYEAKDAGRNCYVVFQERMQEAVKDRIGLERELRAALANDELFVVYQPTVDLDRLSITGLEALLRWTHPTRGAVAPADFIPVAESTGLIMDIGRLVLDKACQQAAAWHVDGLFLEISVNISARQLDAATLYDDVALALQSSGLDPRFLVLEITESALMRDPASAALTLRKIKTLGVRIAIDDFGTGYSSLAYLRQFPVDTLKIDRSFVTQATDSADGEALIDSLVHLGKSLGIKTLAEGIETAAELQQVQRAGCNGGQGYFFGRPMDAQSVRSFLQTAVTSSPATTL